MAEKVKSRSGLRKEDVFEILVEEILSGKLPPGDPLVERVLAERFGLSRTPIREVLLRLHTEHLVDTFPSQGVFVRKLTPQDVLDLFQLREAFEPLAARLAAVNRPVEAVRDLLQRFPRAGDEDEHFEEWGELGRSAHDAIVHWSGNKLMLVMYTTLRKHTQLVRSMTRAHVTIERLALIEHREILRAIEREEPETAHGLMVEHLRRTTNDVMNLLLGRQHYDSRGTNG